ncbi:MAG TPA: 16S rRNA (cytosine(1402)-N(4))-methyltransferase RsmH, partial [Gammaproteobacteria bacterium]|nr:16S rRNA (cytosine(1402)-N(4))-methyltransferase RsmH [Gammaproteobacteria bacterium]
QPVLLREAIHSLAIQPQGVYIDATFGRGGHSQLILSQLDNTGRLLIFDQDPTAIFYARQYLAHEPRVSIFHCSFSKLQAIVTQENLIKKVNGILFDLGISSPQLDKPDRGFSFMREGQLDMRMNPTQGVSAATWLATVSEAELARVLYEYGEERFARRLARAIVEVRSDKPILTTIQLRELVCKVLPVHPKNKHPATRTFLALRLAINQELQALQQGLEQALEVMAVGGRLAVISFHSVEDRIVKRFIQYHERGDDFPPDLPVKHHIFQQKLKRIGRAIRPTEEEVAANPRARSASLRIAEKQL